VQIQEFSPFPTKIFVGNEPNFVRKVAFLTTFPTKLFEVVGAFFSCSLGTINYRNRGHFITVAIFGNSFFFVFELQIYY
jgi:hypothetical protein